VFTKHSFKIALLGISLLALAGLTSCGPQETELSFETIERNDSYSAEEGYGGLEPCVVLVTTRQEIDHLEGLIRQTSLDQLAELDFQQYFAIAVFRGAQATSGYDVIVERVARRGDKIVIYAQFWEPSPHYAVFDAETSPYHIIKVRRSDGVSTQAELVLQSQLVTPTPPSH